MTSSSTADRLGKVSLFGSCTDRELTQIARAGDEITVEPGVDVVAEGSEGQEFYLILDGTATVTRAGAHAADLGPGQYFGELSLLDGAPRSATVTAETALSMWTVGPREFAAVLDSWPGVARKLLVAMAGRLRVADDQAVTN
jgi:CRP/FNR family cyclic AMP-dependent transcriptional regulator